MEGIFGKLDRMKKIKLEKELIGLSPCDFDNFQEFLSKSNYIRLELSNCGITKDGEQLILSILPKLGPKFLIFVSTFYAIMDALGSTYKIPSLDEFLAQLTREQAKLAHMGQLKPSKHQAVVANESTPKASKGKKQHKDPKQHEKGDDSSSQIKSESKFSSREETLQRKRDKCAYCKNLGHDEHKYFHKKIHELTHILQNRNIKFPSSVSAPSSTH